MEDFQIKMKKLELKIKTLEKKISELEKENKKLKDKHYNERGAGRKPKLTEQERELIKMYRIQGNTMEQIANMFGCSIALIHKILKEDELNNK